MGRLQKFAKEANTGVKQTTIRMPVDLYNEFKEICDSLNLTITEGIVKLVELEVADEKKRRNKD